MKTSLMALAVALGGGLAVAGTSTWVKGSTAGWNSEASWTGGIPGPGDTVVVPAGADLPVGDGDVDLAGAVAAVELRGSDSTITFGLTERECTMAGSITGAGTIVKDGTNVVRFMATPKDSYYARGGIRVLAGEVYYPQTFDSRYSSEYMNVGPVYVAAGATLHPYAKYRVTVMNGLSGKGTVANGNSGGAWPIRIDSSTPSVFEGALNWYMTLQFNGPIDLVSSASQCYGAGSVSVYGPRADVGVKTFGHGKDIYTSIGRCYHSDSTPNVIEYLSSGRIRYLGEQEKTDRRFRLSSNIEGTLDACAGQLTLEGQIAGKGSGQSVFVLASSNAVAASVLNCDCADDGTNAIYWVKRGSGAWRFAGSGKRQKAGVVAVEEGTLQIDSLAETNVPCSLGLSTRLARRHVGKWEGTSAYEEQHDADYAVLLGSADAEGTLEYVGKGFMTNGVQSCTRTRPIAVTGKGGRIVADEGRMVGFRGGFAADAEGSTLTLAGTSPNNVFYDLSDRHGPLSVAKEGAGTWVLGGDLTFSGRLAVKEGTLVVSSALGRSYSWYRYTVCELTAAGLTYADPEVRLREIAIYDKDGNRLNGGFTGADANTVPAPGQISGWAENVLIGSETSTAMADDGNGIKTIQVWVSGKKRPPTWQNPERWISFVSRVPAGTAAADSYDVVNAYGWDHVWSPSGYRMEASADGVFWDLVHEVGTNTVTSGSGKWYSDGSAFSAKQKRTGYRFGLDNGKSLFADAPAQLTQAKVSVAPGAVLKAEGEVALHALEIDANGAGTVDGFAIADGGTVNITGIERLDKPLELPLVFANAAGGTDSFAEGWSVKINGARNLARLSYRDGRLTATPSGMILIVR